MHTFDVDLFISFAPRSGIGSARLLSGTCRLDPLLLTITLHLPNGRTITRTHDRDAPLPVILAGLDIDPAHEPV